MAVRIRLRRMGRKKQPNYRVVVTDSTAPRDGRFVEILGYYGPLTEPARLVVDLERVDYWLGQGALPSGTMKSLLKKARQGGDATVAFGEVDAESAKAARVEALAEKRRAEAAAAKKAEEDAAAATAEAAAAKASEAAAAVEAAEEPETPVEAVPEADAGSAIDEAAAEAPAEPEASEAEPKPEAAGEAPEAVAEEAPEAAADEAEEDEGGKKKKKGK
jgi:small subunit ribosomal protein S16